MGERYHATTQNRFYSDMSNVNKNIAVEAKLIGPPMYKGSFCTDRFVINRPKLQPFILEFHLNSRGKNLLQNSCGQLLSHSQRTYLLRILKTKIIYIVV